MIDLGLGFAEDLIPLKGIHCTQEGFAAYRVVFVIGEHDLAGVFGCDCNKAVYVCHCVKSDFVSHVNTSFLFCIFKTVRLCVSLGFFACVVCVIRQTTAATGA